MERVRAAGKINVGVDPSYPPFALLTSTGQPDGFEIELSAEISRRIGVAPDFVGIDVGSVVDALVARKIDLIISGLGPEPEYLKRVVYSRPYFNAGQVIVAKAGGPASPADLAGRTVGVESGSGGDLESRKLAQQTAGLEVRSFTTPEAAFTSAVAGQIDAVVVDSVTARELVPQFPGLTIAGEPFTDDFYVVAGRRADRSLMAEVDRILSQLDGEGYLRSLRDKWVH